MASKIEWNEFFLDAKIPKDVAPLYAENFCKNRMSFDMLADLTKEYLRDLDVSVLGDIISILKHAKDVQSKQEPEVVMVEPDLKNVAANQKLSPTPAPLAQEVPEQIEKKNEVSAVVGPPKPKRNLRTRKLDPIAELAQRFPRLANEIFDSLDNQSLANCYAVNSSHLSDEGVECWAIYLQNRPRFRFKIERLVRRTDRSCGTILQDFIIILCLQCWGMRACDGDYTI